MQKISSISELVQAFRPEFTKPGFANFSFLLIAWITTPFKRTITGLIRTRTGSTYAAKPDKHFSAFHRHSGGIAVPILMRLYRSKKTCPEKHYRKRTELASELLTIAAGWFEGRGITLLGDSEYACKTVLQGMPEGSDFVGPLPPDAQLFSPEVKPLKGRGRRRKWGQRVDSPAGLAKDSSKPWKKITVTIYGKKVKMLVKERVAVWKSGGHKRKLKIVVTRDPKGNFEDRYFFSTRQDDSAKDVIMNFAKRWEQELCFRNIKQNLGVEDVANGYSRARKKRGKKRASPQADKRRKPIASRRTAPFAFIVYGVVVAWYLMNGEPQADVARARLAAPWNRKKESASFSDMLAAFKLRNLIESFPRIQQRCALAKIPLDAIPDWLLAA